MIVSGSNLIVYTAVAGSRTDAAERVRARDPDWVAPPLWRSEVRNALVQTVRHGQLTARQAHGAWAIARSLVCDVEVDPLAALDAAFAYGLSDYDAEFVALAEALGTRSVTGNKGIPETAVSLDDFATLEPDAPGR